MTFDNSLHVQHYYTCASSWCVLPSRILEYTILYDIRLLTACLCQPYYTCASSWCAYTHCIHPTTKHDNCAHSSSESVRRQLGGHVDLDVVPMRRVRNTAITSMWLEKIIYAHWIDAVMKASHTKNVIKVGNMI